MAKTIEILVGTTAGNTEFLASELENELKQTGFQTRFHDLPSLAEVAHDQPWLLCIATHGAGEYAESIAAFMEHLATQQPNLHAIQYAIVAVGDSSYDTFCKAGTDADTLLKFLGAKPVTELLTIDMMLDPEPERTAKEWLKKFTQVFHS